MLFTTYQGQKLEQRSNTPNLWKFYKEYDSRQYKKIGANGLRLCSLRNKIDYEVNIRNIPTEVEKAMGISQSILNSFGIYFANDTEEE